MWASIWVWIRQREVRDYLLGATFYLATVLLGWGSWGAIIGGQVQNAHPLILLLTPSLALGLWAYWASGKGGVLKALPLLILPLGASLSLLVFSMGFTEIALSGMTPQNSPERESITPFGLILLSLVLANGTARSMLAWVFARKGKALIRTWAELTFLTAPLLVPLFLIYLFPLFLPPLTGRKEGIKES